MWRVIHMHRFSDPHVKQSWSKMCKRAVDRSRGQLVDITMVGFFDDELLDYIASRSSQLRRLDIAFSYNRLFESWTEALKKFPLLEELSLYNIDISEEAIEIAGKYCPLLKILRLNKDIRSLQSKPYNEIAIAIGKNLCELRHLELIWNNISNIGLQAILDGCCHFELLDLRRCLQIDLKGGIEKRRHEQIKYLKLPNDSLKGCPSIQEDDYEACDFIFGSGLISDDEYYEYLDYDDSVDFTAYDDDDSLNLKDLNEWMAYRL